MSWSSRFNNAVKHRDTMKRLYENQLEVAPDSPTTAIYKRQYEEACRDVNRRN